MVTLQWSDLFAAGAGCDVAGAYLLARGLVVGSRDIFRRSITGERFFSPPETASQIRDKVDATLGLGILISGFAIQAGAYALVAAGIATRHGTGTAAGVALAVAALAVGAALGVAGVVRWPLTRRIVIDISRDPLHLSANHELVDRETPTAPLVARLVPLAAQFERFPTPGEDDRTFAKRVFRLRDVSDEADFLTTAYRPARFA